MRVVKSRIILVLWPLFGKQENKDTYEMLQSWSTSISRYKKKGID